MNKSADVVLSNNNVRVVVLSASAGITNLLIELAEGCDADKRNQLLQKLKRSNMRLLIIYNMRK